MSNPADQNARYYRSFYGRSLQVVEFSARKFGEVRLASKLSAAYADTVIAQCETDRAAMRDALRVQLMSEVPYV